MKSSLNYLIIKRKNSNEIEYFEYDKLKGYDITPKTTFKDAIQVNKMILIEPTLIETIIKKKIAKRFNHLFHLIKLLLEEDDDTGTNFREALNQLERHRQELINKYKKYLKDEELCLLDNKINILERQVKMQLIYKNKYQEQIYDYSKEENSKGSRR